MKKIKKFFKGIYSLKYVLFYFMVFFFVFTSFLKLIEEKYNFSIDYIQFVFISLICFFTFRIIDIYSTLKVSDEIDDEFEKFKLGKYAMENSILLKKHPKREDVLSCKYIIINIIFFIPVFIISIFYSLLNSYLIALSIFISLVLMTPIIYENNTKTAYFIHNMKVEIKKAKTLKS
jgi:hypothetical protein